MGNRKPESLRLPWQGLAGTLYLLIFSAKHTNAGGAGHVMQHMEFGKDDRRSALTSIECRL
jgi:hypothetical protein